MSLPRQVASALSKEGSQLSFDSGLLRPAHPVHILTRNYQLLTRGPKTPSFPDKDALLDVGTWGFGSRGAKDGDSLWLFEGGRVPYVLRQKQGETYIFRWLMFYFWGYGRPAYASYVS